MENLVFIHIPKTGGTYINQLLFNSNDLSASHKCIKHMGNLKNKIVFATIRNPVSFYNSTYNFYKYPNHPLRSKVKGIVNKYNDINEFTKELLTNKEAFANGYDKNAKYFKHYILSSPNEYGLLTNYFLFIFHYKDYHTPGDVDGFFEHIKNKVHFLKQENLKQDTLDFCNKFNIPYDKTKLDKYVNKNDQKQSVNKEIEALIKEKDYLIYKHFYQH